MAKAQYAARMRLRIVFERLAIQPDGEHVFGIGGQAELHEHWIAGGVLRLGVGVGQRP